MSETSQNAVSHDKPCTMCGTPRSVLVRCQIDDSGKWHFVCPGKCWISVSGGVEDAKGHKEEHPHYRYGGMWKNKHADSSKMSAKKPKKVKDRQKRQKAKMNDPDSNALADETDESEDAGVEVVPEEVTSKAD